MFLPGASVSGAAQHQKRVAKLVTTDPRFAQILIIDPQAQLMVSEVQCFDEGCVPLEVLVIIVGINARWMGKLLCPIADVTQEMVSAELSIPRDWWLHTILFLLRRQEPEIGQEQIESAYEWLEKHGRSTSLLASLESLATAEDRAEAQQALLLLSKCMALSLASPGSSSQAAPVEEAEGVAAVEAAAPTAAEATAPAVSVTVTAPTVEAVPVPAAVKIPVVKYIPPPSSSSSGLAAPRHDKNAGVRQRGCPCCDPDSIDNIVDKFFMNNI